MPRVRRYTVFLAWAAIVTAASAAMAQEDSDEKLLAKHGIAADANGIGAYLRSLRPTPQEHQRIADLVIQLGSDSYREREQATAELTRIGEAARAAVLKAVESDDPEVSLRAKGILAEMSDQGPAMMRAALAVIKNRKLPGLTVEMLEAMPAPQDRFTRDLVVEALAATTKPENTDLLRKAIADGNSGARPVAAAALGKVLGAGAVKDLKALLSDSDDSVRLSAALALAMLGERACLSSLGELLAARDVNIRAEAHAALSGLTGRQFGFVAYEEEAGRSKAAEAWRNWIREEGSSARLFLPFKPVSVELGRTLICDWGARKVIEYDAAGKVTWELSKPDGQPWGCAGLPNGHRLIALHSSGRVIEYDAHGKEVWRKEGLPAGPQGVERLENGNTLIACRDKSKVVEVKPDGTVVWEAAVPGGATSATRLPDGSTLVALQSGQRVVELDREGKETWSLKPGAPQTTAQRLPNGNTLICHNTSEGKVSEYTREGKEVWSFACPRPNSAQRLASGNTLISDGKAVREVTSAGKVVWEKPFGGCGQAVRY